MTMDLIEHVEHALARLGVGPDERLGVAVSGGADSVALAMALASRRPAVLHVDHAMRLGSATDATFVARLADDLGLDFHGLVAPVHPPPRTSPEAVARERRYEALSSCADRQGLDRVATAHTLDDQAETVLMRVIRGTGTDGLAGIAEVRGIFVRPLLEARRADLRRWLEEHGVAWREDETNEDQRFERNWIRHEVLPMLRERRAGVDQTLARLAGHARADAAFLDAEADEVFARSEVDERGVLLPPEVAKLPRAIASRVVRRGLWRMGVEGDARIVQTALALGVGRWHAVGRVVIERRREGLAIVRATEGSTEDRWNRASS